MTFADWQRARNILCIRLDSLGDVLMMTPAMRALKQSLPGCRITLMTSSGGAVAAPFIPEIDATIVYAAPWMKHSDRQVSSIDRTMIQTLQDHAFDAAVIFTTYSQSPLPAAMMCYMADIPLRLAHCRENPYQLLTHWTPETEPAETVRHEVRRQLDLVATVGCHTADEKLSFHVPADNLAWAKDCLRNLGIDEQRPWIMLHPGATAASRRYPPAQWREAASQLAQHLACPLLFTGSTEEAALVDWICQGIPGASTLAGKLDLGRLGAFIALSPLLISNNTGPAHIAAGVGTPVVDLYALTNPQHTPWQVVSRVLFHDVPCRFCYKSTCPEGHHHCLTQVLPERVTAAAIDLLKTAKYGAVKIMPN